MKRIEHIPMDIICRVDNEQVIHAVNIEIKGTHDCPLNEAFQAQYFDEEGYLKIGLIEKEIFNRGIIDDGQSIEIEAIIF